LDRPTTMPRKVLERKTSRVCSVCNKGFSPAPDHKGKIDVCLGCDGQDVEPLMAEVSWEGKQTPIVRVTNAHQARKFNQALKRNCCGPLSSIVTPKEDQSGRESGKSGSGAELGAMYTSTLSEKHHLKR